MIYRVAYEDAPGQPHTFTAADNSSNTISILQNSPGNTRPKDVFGNEIPLLTLGTVRIDIGGGPDTVAPTAQATLPPILTPGATTYDFTVAYTDRRPFDESSLGTGDIRVIGPGFDQIATLVVPPVPSVIGSIHTATYRIKAPADRGDLKTMGPIR